MAGIETEVKQLTLKEIQKKEYEEQFFGMCVEDMKTTFSEILSSSVKEVINQMQSTLVEAMPDKKEGLQRACAQMTESYIDQSKPYVDQFHEIMLKKATIPDNILLPEDHDQLTQYTEDDEKALDEKIEQLTNEYQRLCVLEEAYEGELKNGENLHQLEEEIKILKNSQELKKSNVIERTIESLKAIEFIDKQLYTKDDD